MDTPPSLFTEPFIRHPPDHLTTRPAMFLFSSYATCDGYVTVWARVWGRVVQVWITHRCTHTHTRVWTRAYIYTHSTHDCRGIFLWVQELGALQRVGAAGRQSARAQARVCMCVSCALQCSNSSAPALICLSAALGAPLLALVLKSMNAYVWEPWRTPVHTRAHLPVGCLTKRLLAHASVIGTTA